MNYFKEGNQASKKSIYFGIVALFSSILMTTLAANITINENNRIEFGQGVYVVEACSGWIRITLSSGETVDGISPITGFIIDGLDPIQCASTNIRFKAYEASEDPLGGQLDLYLSNDGENETRINEFTISVDELGNTQLVDNEGTPISNDNPYITLYEDELDEIMTFYVDFSNPLANVNQLTAITVETGPNL